MRHKELPERACIIRMQEVMAQTGLSRSHVLYLARKFEFPSPLWLSDRAFGFLQSEVDGWIASRPRMEFRHD